VQIVRSFEDYGYPPSVEDQVNEPTLKIRVGRVQLDITRRLRGHRRPSIKKIDRRNYYGWFGRYSAEFYVEERYDDSDELPYYFYGSGDWCDYHGRMVDNRYRGE
jgi:hypothetical protein